MAESEVSFPKLNMDEMIEEEDGGAGDALHREDQEFRPESGASVALESPLLLEGITSPHAPQGEGDGPRKLDHRLRGRHHVGQDGFHRDGYRGMAETAG